MLALTKSSFVISMLLQQVYRLPSTTAGGRLIPYCSALETRILLSHCSDKLWIMISQFSQVVSFTR